MKVLQISDQDIVSSIPVQLLNGSMNQFSGCTGVLVVPEAHPLLQAGSPRILPSDFPSPLASVMLLPSLEMGAVLPLPLSLQTS